MDYEEFLKNKMKIRNESGFHVDFKDMNPKLFDFQKFCVQRALKHGRYALFEDTGLGKTIQQIEWAFQVHKHTGKKVLILCPLAVKGQTLEEARKFGYTPENFMEIWNYEQLDNLNDDDYSGVVLDESSIIKNYSGATKKTLVDKFMFTPYKLACSATPSPNDPIELGSHSEFLNQLSGQEMLATFFINDGKDKSEKWKLKKHSVKAFYQWVSTWAVMLNNPGDIGYPMEGYELPGLEIIEEKITTDLVENGELFNTESVSAITFNSELRRTSSERLELAAKIANSKPKESFIIWIKHNQEGEILKSMIPGSVEVAGNDTQEFKEKNLLGFARGEFRVLITKLKIASMGLNYQNCHNQIFASLDFSFEGLYQGIRRCYRFGQKEFVSVYLITTDTMGNVSKTIEEKRRKFKTMQDEMVDAMKQNLGKNLLKVESGVSESVDTPSYQLFNADSIEFVKTIKEDSIDLSIFSPPFSALYTYSDSANDLSNCKDNDEFFTHFKFLVGDLLRITKPGRLCVIHLTQLTTLMGKDGFYSIIDFRGDIIRLFQEFGWNFHAEVTIWKDPQLAAVRTKCVQLLHSQTKRDSTVVRPGLADYLVCFRKPGDNLEPVNYDGQGLPFELWTEYASPVWMDINPSDTLQFRGGKDSDDVKHITPTQLEVWKRAIMLWSNPGEVVFTPFMGIGTEVWQAVKLGRIGVGIELKKSYFDQAKKNMEDLDKELNQMELF